MPRRMGMKRSVLILVTITTLLSGVYLTFFNHPPAEDTLLANRVQSKRRPEWMEKAPVQKVSEELIVKKENNSIEKLIAQITDKPNKINQAIDSRIKEKELDHKTDESVEKPNTVLVKENKDPKQNNGLRHGLKLFDWDKWIADNGFVAVGKIWAFCDEPDPPVVGTALLMADEHGGIKIVTVMNTTFENSILFGTIAVKVEYGGVKLYANEFPACDMAEEDPFFTCPMKAGDQYYMREDHVPGLLPAGNYYTEAKLIDQNEKVVVCANCDLNIK